MSSSVINFKSNVHEWNVDEVTEWLQQNDFHQYHELFRLHHIDGSVLLSLSEHDLRKPPLSISSLGHIKKLSLCILQLRSQVTSTNSMNSTTSSGSAIDLCSLDICRLKKEIKNEVQTYLRMRKKTTNKAKNGHKSSRPQSRCELNTLSASVDSFSDVESNEELSLDDFGTQDEIGEHMPGFPLPRLPKGEYQNFKPEAWKAFVAMLYFFAVTWITAIVMVIVHDRVPDMQTYPPLPDIFLDNVPLIPGAFTMCELCGLILFIMTALLFIFHKHRFIIIRRVFSLFGSVFLLRCITMLITSLSVPGRHLDCKARHGGDWFEKLKQAYQIWQGGGMSIQGVRTCGDYMFSGHTVVLTMLNFFITEYTPRSFYFVHTVSWVLNLFGVFFILAGHEHYSIDVFIAFYISTRIFLYYHTLANNRALYQGDRKRTRIWFPLFYFFEAGVNGIVPNQFEIPGRNVQWQKFVPKSLLDKLKNDSNSRENLIGDFEKKFS